MVKKMEYDLFAAEKKCRCGHGLIYDGALLVCVGCYNLFCPSCFNAVITDGGCFACPSCGWSACA